MKKLAYLGGLVALAVASACSDATAPSRMAAPTNGASHDEITCRSGYIVAYDENGNPYCALEDGRSARPRFPIVKLDTSSTHGVTP